MTAFPALSVNDQPHPRHRVSGPLPDPDWTLQIDRPDDGTPPPLRDRLCGGIPATVPGCVHTDLLTAGLIQDPYGYGIEPTLQWIGRSDWRYTCRFVADEGWLGRAHVELCCDGLDTVASLRLNGMPIGEAANMHRRYRFSIREALRDGTNELTIVFASPMLAAEQAEARYGALPHEGHGSNALKPPHNMLRKMACNFGWDWGPVLPTAGVWRPLRVEAWDTARLGDVVPQVIAVDPKRAVLRVATVVAGDASVTRTHRLIDPEGKPLCVHECRSDSDMSEELVVDDPALWWPIGYGGQPMYTLETALVHTDGRVIDRVQQRVGLRTVELDTTPDAVPGDGSHVDGLPIGERMQLRVNGKPVFLKGANWIPDDCFPVRAHAPSRLDQRIQQAVAANMNCLRVWGGGVYADDHFMARCDELGVLVWHDFMFACAGYPEAAPYFGEVVAEAKDNVARLASHPSLVIWNGVNETIWGTHDWGPAFKKLRRGDHPWGLGYWLDKLPAVVKQIALATPYWAASPYSGSMDRHPNDNAFGNRHIWDVWHGDGQYRNYLGHYPRLSTEFGYHGPPSFTTLDAVLPNTPEHRRWDSPALEFYNRNGGKGGQLHTDLRIRDDFTPSHEDLDAWLFLAQVMQVRALEMGCSWFRALWPWCSGATYWQLNDCWPVSSWSAIDSEGRCKPLWFATRRFFSPRLVTIKPTRPIPAGEAVTRLAVYLHNDTDRRWQSRLLVRRVDLSGQTRDELSFVVDTDARTVQRYDLPEAWLDQPETTALVARAIEGNAPAGWWWFAPDKHLAYPTTSLSELLDASLTKTTSGYDLSLTATSLVRDLCMFPDRLDPAATVSDNCLTLCPGDSVVLHINTKRDIELKQLTTPPVMQAANRFGRACRRKHGIGSGHARPASRPEPVNR
ncbi:MAG: glycoside hydrolase family 2 protein [Planctomycetota bacterium]